MAKKLSKQERMRSNGTQTPRQEVQTTRQETALPPPPAVGAKLRSNGEKPGKLWPAVVIGLLIFGAFLYINWSDLPFVGGAAICLLGVGVAGHFSGWKPTAQFTLTTVLFFAFTLMCGIASVYSRFGEQSSREFARWLIAFLLFLVASIICNKKRSRTLMIGIALAIGLTAVFSIDSASWKGPTDFILGTLLRNDTSAFSYWGDGRISGLFVNPNITGSMFAVGIFLSLHLVRTGKRCGEQIAMYSCLAVSALGFLLSFSMGSIGFFAVAAVVYLVAAGKKERPSVLVLMVETAAVMMLFGVLSTLGLGESGGVALIPDLCMVAASTALWLLDTKVGWRLSDRLAANGKAVAIGLSAVAAVGVLYIVLGFNLAGGMTFDNGESLRRSAYPTAGDYILSVDGDASLNVTIRSQNSQQTAMHTDTVIYEGAAAGAAFTVPEDTRVVYFDLSAEQGGRVDSVTWSGVASGSLKLKYLIIPEFAATRIQGLWANQNVIQRLTFYGDALKIWQKNPVVGMGMGAFEMYHEQVADFYYVSRYAHNVYVQIMAETGLIGILLFLAMLAAFFLAAIKGKNDEENGSMAAPLLACLAMACGHGVFEVIWSSPPYMLVVPLLLALVQINFGGLVRPAMLEKKHVVAGVAVACTVFTVTFAALYIMPAINGTVISRAIQEQDYARFIKLAEREAKYSVYNADIYKASYLDNVFIGGEESLFSIADEIAASMVENGAYDYGMYAAGYYFKRGETALAFDALKRSALWAKANPNAWDKAVEVMMESGAAGATAEEYIKEFHELWQTTSAGQLDGLPLSTIHQAFLKNYAE